MEYFIEVKWITRFTYISIWKKSHKPNIEEKEQIGKADCKNYIHYLGVYTYIIDV